MPSRSSNGFTLVELAIVMIIIGLLIGGVLKGQQLVANAQITSTINQVKAIEASIVSFKDAYGLLPGDLASPSTVLPNCTTAPCSTGGNGDNHINTLPGMGAAPATNGMEGYTFFVHLNAAGLITGIVPSLGVVFGGQFPKAAVNGGFTIGESVPGAAGNFNLVVNSAGMPDGLYLGYWSQLPNNGLPSMSSHQVMQLDTKLDDGAPSGGGVRPIDFGGCVTNNPSGTMIYNEVTTGLSCGVYIYISQ